LFAILIHIGNTPVDIDGCLAPGTDKGVPKSPNNFKYPSVFDSKTSVDGLIKLINKHCKSRVTETHDGALKYNEPLYTNLNITIMVKYE